ncbi:unnamed protein product [Prunus armeniaca]
MESAARSVVIETLAEILTACSEVILTVLFFSFACALVSTMSFLTSVPPGVPKVLAAQISRPGATGVPARSTVRRDGDELWVEDG